MTFKNDILRVAGEEAIEAIVMSHSRDGWSHDHDEIASPHTNRVLTWEEAAPFLDYDYDRGYGGQDCHSVYAWTATRVLLVSEYDGATSVTSVPRHPINCEPVSI